MEKQIVWLIDENQEQIETYARILRKKLPETIIINTLYPPYRELQDYTSLLNAPNTACIIIDQRLKDTGVAKYYGIELAQFLRSINTKLPIYILTNYPHDTDAFSEGEWSVEDIIPKDDLAKLSSKKAKSIIARLLRRIYGYSDFLEERENKYRDLLRKTLTGELSPKDEKELKAIEFDRTSSTLAEELPRLKELQEILDEHKRIVEQFNLGGEDEEK
ncbi:MAG: hypothetical protein ABIL11_16300 [Chloroflexota bacterium]